MASLKETRTGAGIFLPERQPPTIRPYRNYLLREFLDRKVVEMAADYNRRAFDQRHNSDLYSIEFEESFTGRLKPFRLGDPIVRSGNEPSNYIPALTVSLIVAGGGIGRSITVFDWEEIHLNFDMITTIANYINAGGWKILTQEEKMYFLNVYHGANPNRQHHKPLTPETAGEEVDQSLSLFANPFVYRLNGKIPGNELAKIPFNGLLHKKEETTS